MATGMTAVVAIDFGLTYTGAAFGCRSATGELDEVIDFRRWPSHHGTKHAAKAPSAIAYPEHNPRTQKIPWGFQIQPGMAASAWMKFRLDEEASNELLVLGSGPWARAGGALWVPDDKEHIEVVADFLQEVYHCIMRAVGSHGYGCNQTEFWFAVPSTWSEGAKARTRQAALIAGFGTGLGGYPADILFVEEPHAAMTYVISKSSPKTYTLWPGDSIIVCDCGGGTTDVVSYHIFESDPYTYEEISACSSALCGATTVQRALYALMIERFGDAFLDVPLPLRAPWSPFMLAFEKCMAEFDGSNEDGAKLRLQMGSLTHCPRWYDHRKSSVLLSTHDLRNLFDPALRIISNLLSRQMAAANNHPYQLTINKIFLVGGFSMSPYVFNTIRESFKMNDATIVHQPEDPQIATVHGTVLWGSGVLRPATRVSQCHYGIESSLATNIFTADFSFLNSLSSGSTATNDITWLVAKNVTYEEGNFQDFSTFLVHKYGDQPLKPINIYTSTADVAPSRLDQRGVSLALTLVCDLSNLDMELVPERYINGCSFYLIECVVRLTLGANDGCLRLEVMAQDQIINDNEIGLRLG